MKRTRRGPRRGTAWIAAALLLAGSWWNPRATGALPVPVHFDPAAVTASPVSMTIAGYLSFGGVLPSAGAELAAYDPDGVLCGVSGVDPASGAFILHIYGDDDTSAADEGALPGEALTLSVYDPVNGESRGTALIWSDTLPPFTDKGSFRRDVDGPGTGAPDSDGDGVPDTVDACPGTPAGTVVDAAGCPASQPDDENDDDGDGVANTLDRFPSDPAASVDTDGDGFPDAWNVGRSAADSTTGLTLDAFPADPAASLDSDGDGYPDAWNVGYTQADSTTGLILDQYPGNPNAHAPPPTPVVTSAALADGGLRGPLVLRFSPYEGTALTPARVRVAIDDTTAGSEEALLAELSAPGYPVRVPLAPGLLLAGRHYAVQLQHLDATGEWSAWSTPAALAVPAVDPLDTDGDGVQDTAAVAGYTDVDADGVDDRTQAGLVVVAEAQSGAGQPVGLTPSAGSLTAVSVTGTAALPADQQPPSGLTLPYGVFGFRVDGLTHGQDVDMTFHFPAPLPAGTRWLKLDPIDGLVDITDRATITDNRVVLRLTEGATPDDADRVKNAVLIDPSGPAVPAASALPAPETGGGGGGGGGCFLQSLDG
ncbi:MAG TPA: choice-of-anchor U domain-containing protein [Deferrisomatales bacterium]|nr:choice-of-anchor U domain-containing protein [Deferrisomatales bacterium]